MNRLNSLRWIGRELAKAEYDIKDLKAENERLETLVEARKKQQERLRHRLVQADERGTGLWEQNQKLKQQADKR